MDARDKKDLKQAHNNIPGVHLHKASQKWRAQINVNGKTKHLGYFRSFDGAVVARKAAEEKYGGSHVPGKVTSIKICKVPNCFDDVHAKDMCHIHYRRHLRRGRCENDTPRKNNTSGHTGVVWSKARQKWRANIQVDGRLYDLGVHEEMDDAVTARLNAEKKFSEAGKRVRYTNPETIAAESGVD